MFCFCFQPAAIKKNSRRWNKVNKSICITTKTDNKKCATCDFRHVFSFFRDYFCLHGLCIIIVCLFFIINFVYNILLFNMILFDSNWFVPMFFFVKNKKLVLKCVNPKPTHLNNDCCSYTYITSKTVIIFT